jgi:hypothetical protein
MFYHQWRRSGWLALGATCLLAATSLGSTGVKRSEALEELMSFVTGQTETVSPCDHLAQPNRPAVGVGEIAVTGPSWRDIGHPDFAAYKDYFSGRADVTKLSVPSAPHRVVDEAVVQTPPRAEYPDQRLRQEHASQSVAAPQPHQGVPAAAPVKPQPSRAQDSVWLVRWRLIDTLDLGLPAEAHEAMLLSLLLAHHQQGQLNVGWVEVETWLDVLVKHGLAERDAARLRIQLADVYEVLRR